MLQRALSDNLQLEGPMATNLGPRGGGPKIAKFGHSAHFSHASKAGFWQVSGLCDQF